MTTIVSFTGATAHNRRQASPFRHSRFAAAAVSALLWLPRFWKARSELAALAAMSECERRDIGLTAFDVANALTLPVDRDPTEVLAKVVDDRRHRREF
ncbi:MAG: hypothetical protein EOS58_18070 [Mesorhizobium sp.]|uniref:hypothetical protein n=1 Tax=Mesorhizobium sp. M4A.F.Ca.ET.022.05.2.1 TaxID=2496653 RepID=UPI000FCBC242|nr:hypothetical protein [Mesorhizobium sp. M4A.F.Ca.ET.022.05.2.1]RVC74277.1 hypothetical protein EN745_30540 [Mesorhizobium sp. M4A.F.Ca.ET.022.05.2.1]RWD03286.1 MAG: hypothetical protein EOS58_18070 [Mesorhizobium sp.]